MGCVFQAVIIYVASQDRLAIEGRGGEGREGGRERMTRSVQVLLKGISICT